MRNGCRTTAARTRAGCGAAIYLLQPGANTRVRSWCPTPRRAIRLPRHPQRVDLDRRLFHGARRPGKAVYRPTCHYAYHPADDAVLSLHEMFGAAGKMQAKWHILDENEIVDGIDELGVLLYGHDKNAYWYGSQLSIEETRADRALPERHRPAGDLGGAGRHGVGAGKSRTPASSRPTRWISAAASKSRRPYLGPVKGYYTDWTPLTDRPGLFPEDIDTSDPWQFRNVLVR